jgi:hypothetical protein
MDREHIKGTAEKVKGANGRLFCFAPALVVTTITTTSAIITTIIVICFGGVQQS